VALNLNPGISEKELGDALSTLSVDLPSDYKTFLRASDGGKGFVGNNYLVLWRASELKRFNDDYEVREYAPGILIFGSDGAGEAFAFDARSADCPVLMVPFIGMELAHAKRVGRTFTEFLCNLELHDSPFQISPASDA
jgi:hypothetical protein